ncbi:T9SS type A sorting domain-containing protein [Epilithonimonas sp. JDS]|uniref:T9SS type A sorting domain-containing protein n=1 Tax=Epilithonimonas sp. JDS TaxID=2902797 RepID=UPI001E44A5F4|nr:T9SS type A sorting domain-containing protein [Epilithonimonas sp. JDS]MCD9856275.1 T9SS type A sorting domain-containing protein [Epilithonimonas sp. JDS]
MKKIVFFLAVFGSMSIYSQSLGYGKSFSDSSPRISQIQNTVSKAATCNTVVINDTEEENGVFIIGNGGQKAAIDIPIAENQTIKINSIVVTLASKLPPTFVNFIFYDNILSTPEDPEDPRRNIPNQELFSVTNTSIESFEEVGYEPLHEFIIRKVKIKLQTPIVLNGTMAHERIWMSTKSDANAWSTTAHYETGEGVVGESLAMGGNAFGWFQLLNQECLYELSAECDFLNVADASFKSKVDIYPNPAQDYFEYKNLQSMKVVSVNIYDASGKVVKTLAGNQSKVDVQDLPKGVYVVKTKTSSNIILTNKLIKK